MPSSNKSASTAAAGDVGRIGLLKVHIPPHSPPPPPSHPPHRPSLSGPFSYGGMMAILPPPQSATTSSSAAGCSPSACSMGSMSASINASGYIGPTMPMTPTPSGMGSPMLSPRVKEEWFSLEGPLYMKCQSGALSLIQPRKRLYFGLEEIDNKLVFYRTKSDFDGRKDCLGQIPMSGAFCSLDENNFRTFYLHTESGKKYLFEAENESAADYWLNALQERREEGRRGREADNGQDGGDCGGPLLMLDRRHRSRSKSMGHSDSDSDVMAMKGPAVTLRGLERQRARSHYHQQKRQLAPIRVLDASTVSNGRLIPTMESSIASSAPSTPMSMPADGLSRRKFSRATVPRKAASSAMVNSNGGRAPGKESSPKRRQQMANGTSNGMDGQWECCCVCGAVGGGGVGGGGGESGQWVLDSWLRDQQRHTANELKQNERQQWRQQPQPSMDGRRRSTIATTVTTATGMSTGDECQTEHGTGTYNGTGTTTTGTGTASPSEGADEFDLPINILPNGLSLPAAPPAAAECQSTRSSETCESAGALAANERQGREDELAMLRKMCNRQKELILELRTELEKARRGKPTDGHHWWNGMNNGHANESPSEVDPGAAFLAKSRFLNAELVRLNERKQEADKQIDAYKRRIGQVEAEMEEFKKEYIHLLQSCVRIPLRENSACDIVQVKLYGGDEHEKRVKKLLERARESDPTLPTFESVTGRGSFHVDEYGFRHNFEGDVPLALHFISTQLHQHYQAQSADYVQLKARWKALLEAQGESIEKNRESRQLCRLGIPRSLRSRVWRLLIGQQVAELKAKYGPYYYRDLCSSQGTPNEKHYSSAHQKQVNLDLLRTMPGNVHFMSASCKGVTHLQTVLRAYCLHNPSIGYCQGMNFLVATALLFMSPEDAFWFLVAITERYFDQSYFDQSLTGAQADQEVLKEIVEQKFPRLAQHLDECEIDLTTVTLNWFIALFFDAVPFHTMLRIWDCFLMEGPKVLFRFTIALLGLYQEDILAHTDTISVIKVLKAGVKLALDIDGLIKYAFEELNPFPSKAYLRQRQSLYLEVLQERLQKRQQLRQFLNVSGSFAQSDQLCDLPIEVVVFSPFVPGRAYVCAGNQKRGKISMIQLHAEAVNLNIMDLEFDCRPVSMVIFQPEMAFVSLLSGYILAVHLRPSGNAEILWELKLNDVALKLVHCSHRLYSCLANGTLAVLENAFERMPSALDLYHIPIAAAPITDALVDEEHLYLAVACKVVVLNRQTLSTVTSIYVASAAAGSQVPMFEKIRALTNSPVGIWLVTAHSSLLQLWHEGQCEMLFDIRYDHSHRKPSFDEHDDHLDQVEVCSILYHADELWVGTVDGYLMLYRVHLANFGLAPSASKCPLLPIGCPSNSNKYQPGKRLSPAHGLAQAIPTNRQQTYYIPTESEKQFEERNSSMEFMMDGPERQASRKISVKIDQHTRKYSVNVLTFRQPSVDSGTTSASLARSSKAASGPITQDNGPIGRSTFGSVSTEPIGPPVQRPITRSFPLNGSSSNNSANANSLGIVSSGFEEKRLQFTKQQSIDSALSSLFDAGSGTSNGTSSASGTGNGIEEAEENAVNGKNAIGKAQNMCELFDAEEFNDAASSATEEEDDEVEEDDEEEGMAARKQQMEEAEEEAQQRRRRFPSKLVRINSWRRMASVAGASTTAYSAMSKPIAIGPRSSSFSTRKMSANGLNQVLASSFTYAGERMQQQQQQQRKSSTGGMGGGVSNGQQPQQQNSEEIRIRRKDLDFDEPLLLAVKDGESLSHHHHSLGTSPPTRQASLTKIVEQAAAVAQFGAGANGGGAAAAAAEMMETTEIRNSLAMALQMKLKVADKPVRCIALGHFGGQDVIVTGAGEYGDEEALLRWRRDPNSCLWINDPLVDIGVRGRKRTGLSSPTRKVI